MTFNLRKQLRAAIWCDPMYYHEGDDQYRDQSGRGNHANLGNINIDSGSGYRNFNTAHAPHRDEGGQVEIQLEESITLPDDTVTFWCMFWSRYMHTDTHKLVTYDDWSDSLGLWNKDSSENDIGMAVRNGDSTYAYASSGISDSVNDPTFHTATGVCDAENEELRAYFNGELGGVGDEDAAVADLSDHTSSTTASDLNWGDDEGLGGGSAQDVEGELVGMMVWDRALSDQEIRVLNRLSGVPKVIV